jgi:hypothetical protein
VVGERRTRTDRVLVSTRVLAAAIVPFLVLAFIVLVPWPTDTRRLFAWEIKPTMSAMVLGSVYLGGAYFFFRVVRASRWHTVAGGFVPVGMFATLNGPMRTRPPSERTASTARISVTLICQPSRIRTAVGRAERPASSDRTDFPPTSRLSCRSLW